MKQYKYLTFLAVFFKTISAGIEVPKDSCYWLSGAYGVDLSCDQDHVVVGACGAGKAISKELSAFKNLRKNCVQM